VKPVHLSLSPWLEYLHFSRFNLEFNVVILSMVGDLRLTGLTRFFEVLMGIVCACVCS
jgi:hypothetical protein